MAKQIKFALEMADHAKVRTIEDLRRHFDLESIIGYVLDGKLQKWLEYRYYEREAEALKNLDDRHLDIKSLYTLLGVVCPKDIQLKQIDVEAIRNAGEKLDKLKQLTNDITVWEKVEQIAFSQEEMEELLKKGKQTIYLCGERFFISGVWEEISYIGILSTPQIESDMKNVKECRKKKITFSNVSLPQNLKDPEYRPVEEKSRFLYFPVPWVSYSIDKKRLADQDVYPDMDWYHFVYDLFGCEFDESRTLPMKWEEFMKKPVWNIESMPRFAVNILTSQYVAKRRDKKLYYYDVICELLRYFLQKNMEEILALNIPLKYKELEISSDTTRIIAVYGCICDRLAGKCRTWTIAGPVGRLPLRKEEKEIAQVIYEEIKKVKVS